MAAYKLRVEYTDGRVETVLTTAKAHVLVERDMRGVNKDAVLEFSHRLAHKALVLSGKEDERDFEVWLDGVADVDTVAKDEADERAEDPTRTAQSTTGSPG